MAVQACLAFCPRAATQCVGAFLAEPRDRGLAMLELPTMLIHFCCLCLCSTRVVSPICMGSLIRTLRQQRPVLKQSASMKKLSVQQSKKLWIFQRSNAGPFRYLFCFAAFSKQLKHCESPHTAEMCYLFCLSRLIVSPIEQQTDRV